VCPALLTCVQLHNHGREANRTQRMMRRMCDWQKVRTQPGAPVHDKWPETGSEEVTRRHYLADVVPWSVPDDPAVRGHLHLMADHTRVGDMHLDEHFSEVT
jgi:hypothetical protein